MMRNINLSIKKDFTMTIIGAFALSSLIVLAPAINPNGIDNKAEPGWSLWRIQEEVKNADFDSGFSNSELGGYLEFENACKTSSELAESEIKYWFRLSGRVNRIGTGKVEFGCWDGKRFLRVIANGKSVKPGYFPATIINRENLNWVSVTSPIEGWISDGGFVDEGNLELCSG